MVIISDYRETLTNLVEEYCSSIPELNGETPSVLLIDFVVEKYIQHRNFPSSFTDAKINEDITNHINTIAMGCVDLFCKVGMEGEKGHSENGTSRTFNSAYLDSNIFADVMPYVKLF